MCSSDLFGEYKSALLNYYTTRINEDVAKERLSRAEADAKIGEIASYLEKANPQDLDNKMALGGRNGLGMRGSKRASGCWRTCEFDGEGINKRAKNNQNIDRNMQSGLRDGSSKGASSGQNLGNGLSNGTGQGTKTGANQGKGLANGTGTGIKDGSGPLCNR